MSSTEAPLVLGFVGFVLGLIFGSFVGVLVTRWPKGARASAGRSSCDHCGAPLGAADLVPIWSFIRLRGCCRHCGARIDPALLGIELAAGLVGMVAMLAHPFPASLVTLALGLWLLLVAILDLRFFWLPNRLTLPLIPIGLLVGWAGIGPTLEDRIIGAAAGWLVLEAIAFVYGKLRGRRGLGGGDPKLLAGLGAFVGYPNVPLVLVGSGLIGLAAIAAMRMRGEEVTATTRLPMGTLMALAAWPIWLVAAGG